jgi:hypothetical protein
MKTITESKVRQIIREEMETIQVYKQVVPAIKSVLSFAERFVESVISGDRDSDAADGLVDATSDLKTIVKLLQKNRAPESNNMALLARLSLELADKSGFWKTPLVLGKDKHIKELATQLARMKKVAKTIVVSISAARQDM